MRQLDLFAGVGGISLAAEWAGIETVAFCEKEPFAQNVLRRRFPGRPIYDDVFNLNREVLERDGIIGGGLPGIDIVAGGFPCQPFSHAGKRAGTADDRYLWPEMCRIVGELRPSWVFAENVDGLVSMAQSDWEFVMEDEATICEEAEMVIETIRQDLTNLGYESIPVVVPACAVGASHRRYRVFILAYADNSEWRQDGASCGRVEGPNAVPQREEGSGRFGEQRETLADSALELSYGVGRERRGRSEHPDGSQALADTSGRRFREARRSRSNGSEEWASGGSEALADSGSAGREERHASAIASQSGYGSRSRYSIGAVWSAQPGMGGIPYELSDWLDGWGMNPLDALINFISSFPQPALMGQDQFAWEPPRVATGVKNRAARLKALGNAVDPLQALPVLYGIRVIHEYMQRGGRID